MAHPGKAPRGDQCRVDESAKALTLLAHERETLTAPVMEPDPAADERFAVRFPFNETADQAGAIAAVSDDLVSGRRMDRLVIGDVGYGQTEIALRAAAPAAASMERISRSSACHGRAVPLNGSLRRRGSPMTRSVSS